MLDTVVIMFKCASRIVGRIDEYAFHLTRILRLQSFESQEVVAEDQLVVEDVCTVTGLGAIGLLGFFDENSRLQLGAILLADPSEFEFDFCHLNSRIAKMTFDLPSEILAFRRC